MTHETILQDLVDPQGHHLQEDDHRLLRIMVEMLGIQEAIEDRIPIEAGHVQDHQEDIAQDQDLFRRGLGRLRDVEEVVVVEKVEEEIVLVELLGEEEEVLAIVATALMMTNQEAGAVVEIVDVDDNQEIASTCWLRWNGLISLRPCVKFDR